VVNLRLFIQLQIVPFVESNCHFNICRSTSSEFMTDRNVTPACLVSYYFILYFVVVVIIISNKLD